MEIDVPEATEKFYQKEKIMTTNEKQLTAILLRFASYIIANDSNITCDFRLPDDWTQTECDLLHYRIYDWMGKPEDAPIGSRHITSFTTMDFLADRIEKSLEQEL
jgi:hypothetical protein